MAMDCKAMEDSGYNTDQSHPPIGGPPCRGGRGDLGSPSSLPAFAKRARIARAARPAPARSPGPRAGSTRARRPGSPARRRRRAGRGRTGSSGRGPAAWPRRSASRAGGPARAAAGPRGRRRGPRRCPPSPRSTSGAGQIGDGLGQRQLALRQADQLAGLGRGHGQRQGGRIGIAHVLAGQDHQPPGEEPHVFAPFEHAGQPVQGGVGIAAANALDQRADRVVMGVALRGRTARPCAAPTLRPVAG